MTNIETSAQKQYGFITHETYMQDSILPLNLKDGTVNNHIKIHLPCSLNKNCCDSGSTGPYTHTWENRKLFMRKITHLR